LGIRLFLFNLIQFCLTSLGLKFIKQKSSRVKAIRLRGVWSEGIIEKPETVNCPKELLDSIGSDISEVLGMLNMSPQYRKIFQPKGFCLLVFQNQMKKDGRILNLFLLERLSMLL